MKKAFQFCLSAIVVLAAASLASCNRNNGGDEPTPKEVTISIAVSDVQSNTMIISVNSTDTNAYVLTYRMANEDIEEDGGLEQSVANYIDYCKEYYDTAKISGKGTKYQNWKDYFMMKVNKELKLTARSLYPGVDYTAVSIQWNMKDDKMLGYKSATVTTPYSNALPSASDSVAVTYEGEGKISYVPTKNTFYYFANAISSTNFAKMQEIYEEAGYDFTIADYIIFMEEYYSEQYQENYGLPSYWSYMYYASYAGSVSLKLNASAQPDTYLAFYVPTNGSIWRELDLETQMGYLQPYGGILFTYELEPTAPSRKHFSGVITEDNYTKHKAVMNSPMAVEILKVCDEIVAEQKMIYNASPAVLF